MPSIVRALSGCLLVVASFACRAEALWLCTLADDAVRLVCVAEHDPLWPEVALPAPSAQVRGTSFPLDPTRTYTVDLWSPPTDWSELERLAQATICFRTLDCTAVVPLLAADAARCTSPSTSCQGHRLSSLRGTP